VSSKQKAGQREKNEQMSKTGNVLFLLLISLLVIHALFVESFFMLRRWISKKRGRKAEQKRSSISSRIINGKDLR